MFSEIAQSKEEAAAEDDARKEKETPSLPFSPSRPIQSHPHSTNTANRVKSRFNPHTKGPQNIKISNSKYYEDDSIIVRYNADISKRMHKPRFVLYDKKTQKWNNANHYGFSSIEAAKRMFYPGYY